MEVFQDIVGQLSQIGEGTSGILKELLELLVHLLSAVQSLFGLATSTVGAIIVAIIFTVITFRTKKLSTFKKCITGLIAAAFFFIAFS